MRTVKCQHTQPHEVTMKPPIKIGTSLLVSLLLLSSTGKGTALPINYATTDKYEQHAVLDGTNSSEISDNKLNLRYEKGYDSFTSYNRISTKDNEKEYKERLDNDVDYSEFLNKNLTYLAKENISNSIDYFSKYTMATKSVPTKITSTSQGIIDPLSKEDFSTNISVSEAPTPSPQDSETTKIYLQTVSSTVKSTEINYGTETSPSEIIESSSATLPSSTDISAEVKDSEATDLEITSTTTTSFGKKALITFTDDEESETEEEDDDDDAEYYDEKGEDDDEEATEETDITSTTSYDERTEFTSDDLFLTETKTVISSFTTIQSAPEKYLTSQESKSSKEDGEDEEREAEEGDDDEEDDDDDEEDDDEKEEYDGEQVTEETDITSTTSYTNEGTEFTSNYFFPTETKTVRSFTTIQSVPEKHSSAQESVTTTVNVEITTEINTESERLESGNTELSSETNETETLPWENQEKSYRNKDSTKPDLATTKPYSTTEFTTTQLIEQSTTVKNLTTQDYLFSATTFKEHLPENTVSTVTGEATSFITTPQTSETSQRADDCKVSGLVVTIAAGIVCGIVLVILVGLVACLTAPCKCRCCRG